MVEQQKMSGILTLIIRDREGRTLEERRLKNKITNKGRELVAGLFSRTLNTVPELFIVVGQGDQAADEANTTLMKQVERIPATAVSKGNVVTVTAKLSNLADLTAKRELKEAGILALVKVGESQVEYLYNRVTFAVVTQTSSTDILLSWEVTF